MRFKTTKEANFDGIVEIIIVFVSGCDAKNIKVRGESPKYLMYCTV